MNCEEFKGRLYEYLDETLAGDVQASVEAGQTGDGTGLVINSSRAILYAGHAEDFALHAREAARRTRDEINRHRRRSAS